MPGRRAGLPVELTTFVGRERELTALRDLLAEVRCVTLTGAGGSGKTRLAVELGFDLAPDLSDGAVFVDLAPLSDPTSVSQAVAEAIGLVESARRGPEEAITVALKDAHLLILLDNCEHLLDACAPLVERLLKSCPRLHVLATSRQPLDVPGEVTFAVPPLTVPEINDAPAVADLAGFEGVQLFVDRAAMVRGGFALDNSNARAVALICGRLDGLPLAIELAAARMRSMTPAEIEQRLGDRFKLLARGPRTAVPRHQTLRATIDWSHELLATAERVLFRRLAAFSGGWTLQAAEAVCSFGPLDGDLLDIHERLVEKSLVTTEPDLDGASRYRFLETIRQYATERLLAAAERETMRRRHCAFFLDMAERYDDQRTTQGSDRGLPALARERDNLRAALAWVLDAEPESALRLTIALDDFWHMVNPAEGWSWLQRALGRAGGNSAHRARGLLVAGKLAGYVRAYAEGTGLLREVLYASRTSADPLMEAAANLWLGRLALFGDDPESAEDHLNEALAMYDAGGNALGRVRTLALLGLLQGVIRERRDHGEPVLQQAAALAEAVGDSWGAGYAHMMLAICAADAGDGDRAYEQASLALETPSIAPLHAVPLQQLARVTVETDPGRSLKLLGAAARILERDGTEEPRFLARRADAARTRAEQLVGSVTATRLFYEGRKLSAAELGELAGSSPMHTAAARPGGLTRRELQIAALVGRLQTNREIASTLFLSVRTAESHIEHILAKLRLANRRELAAWARGNGLVAEERAEIP